MQRSLKLAARAAGILAVCGAGFLQADTPTIVISPSGYITAGLGATRQFSASLSGAALPVTWTVGRPGLNAGLGTISSTGLYTAPSVLPSNTQIAITATSIATPSLSTVTYLYLLPNGPTLTSASPNPQPPGTIKVTLTGGGFKSGAEVMCNNVQYGSTFVNATTLTVTVYLGPATTSASYYVLNPGTGPSAVVTVPVSASGSGGATGSTGSSGSTGSTGSTGATPPAAPVVTPAAVTVALGATQTFTASNVTGWSAVAGTVTAAGVYTAPAVMPASGTDTVTATGPGGTGKAAVTLVSNIAPVIQSLSTNPLPLGVFSTTITGTGFQANSVVQLGGLNLTVTASAAPTSLTVAGFAGTGGSLNLTVSNGPVASLPFAVNVGVQNPMVSPSAARRFLEQAAFGATPADAAHLQTIGFQAWLAEQFNLPVVSNYNPLLSSSQGGMPAYFLANAVTNQDQLRQRVAFALSQIFVASITKVIWNGDMIPYENMLINDAFTNYRQILGDVTLSPCMGYYLDMANNAKANPAAGTVANENYAREVMQLFSLGTVLLHPDGTPQLDGSGNTIPTYSQTDVTEQARVITGWTNPPAPGKPVVWGAYITENGPMVYYSPMHDFGSKTLVGGHVAPANLSPDVDLSQALDNLANHPNAAPYISKLLIQHLVKSNPSPAYVQRVSGAFLSSNGDMKTVISAILLDAEARANDEGGNDQASDGHLQEPALMLPAFVRAFGGQMTTANYYSSVMADMGQDIYNPASVFNYYSEGFTVGGTGGLKGGEFQIDNPNNTIVRENMVATFFAQYQNPVQTYGPGTTVDLTAFLPLASNPATLVAALDLTLTHGTMPAGMKQTILTAVTADNTSSLHRVQTGIYLILTSSYYNVWH
jgi:uncharacterized protein (DUF1800 family)